MYISGAKFKDHCSNISRDMLDWVLDCFSGTTYDVITHNTRKNENEISLKRKKIILLYAENPFKSAAIIFYFIGTLKYILQYKWAVKN